MPAPFAASVIMEALPTHDGSGWVDVGKELTFPEAAGLRAAARDVVVCGDDHMANRRLAVQVEGAVGPASRPQPPHASAGPHALPHYHQQSRVPTGPTFYETSRLRARR